MASLCRPSLPNNVFVVRLCRCHRDIGQLSPTESVDTVLSSKKFCQKNWRMIVDLDEAVRFNRRADGAREELSTDVSVGSTVNIFLTCRNFSPCWPAPTRWTRAHGRFSWSCRFRSIRSRCFGGVSPICPSKMTFRPISYVCPPWLTGYGARWSPSRSLVRFLCRCFFKFNFSSVDYVQLTPPEVDGKQRLSQDAYVKEN